MWLFFVRGGVACHGSLSRHAHVLTVDVIVARSLYSPCVSPLIPLRAVRQRILCVWRPVRVGVVVGRGRGGWRATSNVVVWPHVTVGMYWGMCWVVSCDILGVLHHIAHGNAAAVQAACVRSAAQALIEVTNGVTHAYQTPITSLPVSVTYNYKWLRCTAVRL